MLEIRDDLIDCGIDVCSVDVPSLFQDNFDYQDLRRDFLYGVLTSELLMKKVHTFVARKGYAARVRDTRSYDSVRYVRACVLLVSFSLSRLH
jgi:translation initiation factor eIF-2B subunit epsilon